MQGNHGSKRVGIADLFGALGRMLAYAAEQPDEALAIARRNFGFSQLGRIDIVFGSFLSRQRDPKMV